MTEQKLMDDTSPDIAKKMREMFQKIPANIRLKMGFSMHETSKYLIARAIWEDTPIYSGADLRKELFLRFYGNDFDPATRQKILNHLGTTPTVATEIKPGDFEHIPETEKEKRWWLLLYPLIKARLLREKPENSKLLKVLRSLNGFRSWRDIKNSIELALANVKDGEQILARTSEIKNSPDPDGVVDDMCGELRTIPYLLMKGFKNIGYFRRNNLDFQAEFAGNIFYIESTYVHGPDFKTQDYMFTPKSEISSSIYKIRPDKLIHLLERVYSKKKEQILRHHSNPSNSLIFMITDLEETNAPWLDHAKIEGVHPILQFILSSEIPVVVFGCESVYEPTPDCLGGTFGKLQVFDWQNFANRYLNSLSVHSLAP